MMALSKRSRYPSKGLLSPYLILNKYEISFFQAFALRNAAKKASYNYLNKSIIPSINLWYHCPVVPIRVM